MLPDLTEIAEVAGSGSRIGAALFADCQAHFSGSTLREVLLAAAGVKASRIVADEAQTAALRRLADSHGFSVVEGRSRRIAACDVGKGHCNKGRSAAPGEAGSFLFTYLAGTAETARSAMERDESCDSSGFGELLGIPECCREAYRKFEPIARRKQGDLLPQIWKNTDFETPFDPWLNIAARYFGFSLISFFPCSFHCRAARFEAQRAYGLLLECGPAFAASLLEAQRTNVIYTEYEGVHAIGAPLNGDTVVYDGGEVKCTSNTRVARMIRAADRLVLAGRQKIDLHRGGSKVGTIEGAEIYPCFFRRGEEEATR